MEEKINDGKNSQQEVHPQKTKVTLTVDEIQKINRYAKLGVKANRELAYAILSKDFSIDMEDLEQEILTKLLLEVSRNGSKILQSGNYVAVIAHNALRDYSDKVQCQKRHPHDAELISLDSMRYDAESGCSRTVEEETADLKKMPMEKEALAKMVISEKIKSFTPEEKELFDMLYVEGVKQKEAANMLGVSAVMICKRKKKLDDMLFGED